jgi:hypothetical protein
VFVRRPGFFHFVLPETRRSYSRTLAFILMKLRGNIL